MPIILLTARGEEADRIAGPGAPARTTTWSSRSARASSVARVKAQLRRVELDTAPPSRTTAGCAAATSSSTPAERTCEAAGAPINLTPKEFDLLHHLMAHPGQVFTRDQLLDAVWDPEYFGDPSTVTVHIRRLREKIERDPDRPTHIKTVWGVGYKFDPSA